MSADDRCPSGKRWFVTRAEASRAAKALYRRYGGTRTRSFRCPHEGCNGFHIGTAPAGLLHGDYGRDEVRLDRHA